jgi:hypothetical protein
MRLYEWDKKGGSVEPGAYEVLYHLTDHHGYAYTIDRNSLESPEGVCTTTNPKMDGVPGRWHYDFKLVLSGKIIEYAGAHHYTAHFQYVGDDDNWHAYSEDEVRLDAHKIAPISNYILGTVLLFNLFSEQGIQWLLYGNGARHGLFSKTVSKAPRTVDMLYKHLYEWKKPVWSGKVGKLLSRQEIEFIRDAYAVSQRGGTFKDGMIELCRKYPVVNHWGKPLDAEQARRQFLAPKLVKMLNGYYENRDRKNIKIPRVRKLIQSIFEALGVGNNAVSVLMHQIEVSGLFHVMTPPVVWSGVIREVMNGDIDEAIKNIEFLGQREQSSREWHDNSGPEDWIRRGTHSGTMFGRSSDHG